MSKDQEAAATGSGPGQQPEQQAALYGAPGKADHQPGDSIRFSSADTGAQTLTGSILYVRAHGPAIVGGRSHPTTYIVFVAGEQFPRMVYPADVIEE